jgi:Short C-terminal domain
MCAHLAAGYHRAMLLRPLRRAPMMLGGVGFQAGLDEVRRKQIEAQRQAAVAIHAAGAPAPNVVEQLKDLKALLDDGALSPEEFQVAKRKVLGG